MTPREIKRIKRTLDTLEAGFTKRALQHFATILPEIEPFVEDALRTGNADGFEMPGKKRYLVLFKRYIQECFVQGMNLADQELLARRARFDDQKQQPPPVIPDEAMAWMDRWTERFGPDYYGDLTQDVVGTLKRALGEGLSVEHTMDQLEHVLTGPAYNKNRLDIIARTNATTAFNQGRLEMFNQDPDFVPYVEFLAILDSRTTDICEARNGKIFRTGSADLAANTPPLHYRCRSILSPVTIYDLEDMQKAGWKDAEGKTLQQKMDLSGMPELPKGFGSVGRNVPEQELDIPRGNQKPGNNLPTQEKAEQQSMPKQKENGENDFAKQVKGRVSNGVNTPEDVKEVGEIIRHEVEKTKEAKRAIIETRMEEARKELTDLRMHEKGKWRADWNHFRETQYTIKTKQEYDAIVSELNAREFELTSREKNIDRKIASLAAKRKEIHEHSLLEVLKKVRKFGNDDDSSISIQVAGGVESHKARKKVREVYKYYPADWWESSNGTGLKILHRPGRAGYDPDEKCLRMDLIDPDKDSVIHELAHRFEHEHPGLRKLNYDHLMSRVERGKGDLFNLNSQLPPEERVFGKNEQAYTNTGFCHPYMGKPCRFSHTEVLSVGMEATIFETFPIWEKDIDSVNYILGVLGAL